MARSSIETTARRLVRRTPAGRRIWNFAASLDRHGAFRGASAMAFDAFLSAVPLLALAGWGLHQTNRADFVIGALLRHAGPARELADVDLLRLSDGAVMTLAPVSAIVFIWLSSSGIATAMGVCETMFAAEERTWLRRRAIAMAWVLAFVAVIVIATAAGFALTDTLGAERGRSAAGILSLPVAVGVVHAFFHTAIRRPPGIRRRVLPGAIVTVCLWTAVTFGFFAYVQTLARYSLFYGSLAAVAVGLVWLWLLALALLMGGEVNAHLEGVRDAPPTTTFPTVRTRDPFASDAGGAE